MPASTFRPTAPPLEPVLPPVPRQIAHILADRAALWRPLVQFTEPRFYTRIAQGPELEAWLLTWLPGQRTGLHDHGGSAGAFAVLGGFVDEALPSHGHLLTRRYRAGQVRSFGPDHVHEVAAHTLRRALTLHVYAPRLTTMTRYALVDGELTVTATEQEGADW
jgi:quercetin dioxygenase-like cupin family protein